MIEERKTWLLKKNIFWTQGTSKLIYQQKLNIVVFHPSHKFLSKLKCETVKKRNLFLNKNIDVKFIPHMLKFFGSLSHIYNCQIKFNEYL